MARKRNPQCLESQLASVVEQDGVILNTPYGVRRKKNVARRASYVPTPDARPPTPDDVAALDCETVSVLCAKNGGTSRVREIPIRRSEHPRSPYVVSLQRVVFSSQARARDEHLPSYPASQVVRVPRSSSHPIESYAAVSTDLCADHAPWHVADQFTPNTFEDAYRASYGGFDRIADMMRDACSAVGGFFRRAEEIEERAISDLEASVGVSEMPRFSFVRALVAFAGLALVVTLPANAFALYRTVAQQKDAVKNEGAAAVRDLLAAGKASSLPESASALRNASSRFRAVDSLLADTNTLALGAASLFSGTYRSARALAETGEKSSEAARLLAIGFDTVFADPSRRLDERLDVLGAYAHGALTLLADASKAAATVSPASLPAPERPRVESLLAKLEESTQAVQEFAGLADILARMAGKDGLRNYLLIFQNQTELRPTGGFMGSFAEVTMDRGAVKRLRVPTGGTYELKGQLTARVRPPKPLQLVATEWQFQDANWSPDFPTSAKKIRWFWSKSRQATVDGIITLNASFIEKLLALTGPVELPEYGKKIDSTNFLFETQQAVELEYDHEANTPKKFIGDLSATLFGRLKSLSKNDWMRVAALVSDALETKEIQVALFRPDEEELVERYGWNGRLKETSGDALALIEANIAGQKTDGVIRETVDQTVDIQEDGTITTTVKLTRAHEGKRGELFRGVRNVSYLRAYVPKGSTLLSTSGFNAPPASLFKKIDETTMSDPDRSDAEGSAWEEGSRTVFGGWMQLDPGATQTITFTYRLPQTTADIASALDISSQRPAGDPALREGRGAYLVLLTSQSGKTSRTLHTTIRVPRAWDISWMRPDHLTRAGSSVQATEQWDRDRAIALLFSPHVQKTF